MNLENQVTIVISLIAIVISLFALIFTVKMYLLKLGCRIKGSFGIGSSVACEDKYVSHLILENLKDRAIIIYKIYLQLGYNYYLEVEDFQSDPLVLKPFEIYKKDYEPIDFYSVNLNRILINDFIDNKKVKKRLVLSTSMGKYKIKSNIKYWDPISIFFKNYTTALIRPMRSMYKGKSYGENVKFIIDIIKNGKTDTIAIYPEDYRIRKLKKFNFTRESLESKETIEAFLYKKAIDGLLNCDDFTVHEVEKWREEVYEWKDKKVIIAEYYNWWTSKVVGFIYTKYDNYKLNKENKELEIKRNK